MPFSSMARIRVASVYRAGGWVNCCSGDIFSSFTVCPSVILGRGLRALSPSSSRASSYMAV